MSDTTAYEFVIRPRRAWWEVDWRGLLHFQDLLWLLVRRDFVSKYKQTVLGPAWMVLQPLAMTLVFSVIFGRLAGMSTEGASPTLFYLCGLLSWNVCSGVLSGAGNSLQANLGLFSKVYFPRIIVPVSIGISALIPFVIQLITFLCFLVPQLLAQPGGGGARLGRETLLVPLFLAQSLAIGLGAALLFSAMTAVYRDLQHMLGFAVQLWMYATPIIYPVSQFPERWRWIPLINPMSVPVEGFKWAFLGGGTLTAWNVALSWAVTFVLLVLGFFWFNVAERSYVDRA